MNEQAGNAEYEFLWKLLANPANPNHSYIFSLQSLVNDFPQSGALRALLMPNGDKRNIKHASAYFNPRVLHKLATSPDSLAKVTAEQVVFSDATQTVVTDAYLNIPVDEPFIPPVSDDTDTYTPVIDDSEAELSTDDSFETSPIEFHPATSAATQNESTAESTLIVDPERENIPAYVDEDDKSFYSDVVDHGSVYQNEQSDVYGYGAEGLIGTPIEDEPVHEEISEAPTIESLETTSIPFAFTQDNRPGDEEVSLAKQYDAYLAESEAAPTMPVSSFEESGDRYFHQAIDDEVYDEIVSIEDIGLEQLAILNKSVDEGNTENYFVFEPEITEPSVESPESVQLSIPQSETEILSENSEHTPPDSVYSYVAEEPVKKQVSFDEKSKVSKYNDEKMPYTFMWWLDKTRKEHADIYQPYIKGPAPIAPSVEKPKQKEPLDELQQQYYQNIVSTTSITELDKNPPKAPAPPPQRKEDKIIERFIHEEPQIKHPTGVKLDNENKAKRSSEDKEELVTETLARIYTEQMLYHKAILTYKKLMLKYPEKSLYFAGQIEQLESKIN